MMIDCFKIKKIIGAFTISYYSSPLPPKTIFSHFGENMKMLFKNGSRAARLLAKTLEHNVVSTLAVHAYTSIWASQNDLT